MSYRVVMQHGVRVNRDSAVDQIEQPVAAEKARRVDQTTKFYRYQYGHYSLHKYASPITVIRFRYNLYTKSNSLSVGIPYNTLEAVAPA